ncbi:Uncharacterized protein SCF082_LOCUS13627 [Durusdinium trenchii]|uniref:Uncharacterized protein n=1 Tax=Durusdinium trenchii TaxID=1381693 RepID=A0ABP0JTL4_9DINO
MLLAKVEDGDPKAAKSSRDLIWECFQQVTANTNLGTWLNDEYGDRTKMSAVLDRVVMDRPCKEPIPGLVAIEPLHTLNECFIGIDQLDYGQNAKHGYFPHMATVATHFKNIVYRNFDPYREPLCIRFVSTGERTVQPFSVKYVDGFTKGLICQSIAAIVDKLGIPEEELDSDDLKPLLLSLRFFKAKYTHMPNQEDFFYEALRLGQETAEKQQPSALDMVGIFDQAVAAFFQHNGRKVSFQSALNSCIADFNKSVKVRKFKVDTLKRKIITNLLKVPKESVAILAAHYDLHRKPQISADLTLANLAALKASSHDSFPYEVVANGHFVPQNDRCELSRYRGSDEEPTVLPTMPNLMDQPTFCGEEQPTLFHDEASTDEDDKAEKLLEQQFAEVSQEQKRAKFRKLWHQCATKPDQDLHKPKDDARGQSALPQENRQRPGCQVKQVDGLTGEEQVSHRDGHAEQPDGQEQDVPEALPPVHQDLQGPLRQGGQQHDEMQMPLPVDQSAHQPNAKVPKDGQVSSSKSSSSSQMPQPPNPQNKKFIPTPGNAQEERLKNKKDEKDEDEDDEAKDEDNDMGDAEDGDDMGLGTLPTTNALSDFQYNFEAELRQPSRNLLVKDLMICFDPSTVYGNRAAFMKGMMITAKHASPGGNVFWKSPLWKRGVIGDVAMLARAEMYKPPCQETIEVKMNAAFTDCQEAKQVSWI